MRNGLMKFKKSEMRFYNNKQNNKSLTDTSRCILKIIKKEEIAFTAQRLIYRNTYWNKIVKKDLYLQL